MGGSLGIRCTHCALEQIVPDGTLARAFVRTVACNQCEDIKGVVLWSADEREDLREELDSVCRTNIPGWEARADELAAKIALVRRFDRELDVEILACPSCSAPSPTISELAQIQCPRCRTGQLKVEQNPPGPIFD